MIVMTMLQCKCPAEFRKYCYGASADNLDCT